MSSSNPNSAQPQTPVEAPSASVGALLREAREQAGLTSDELARRLCMTPVKLEALERDEFDRFPGSTYVRGYIRNICKELGTDEAQALAAYAQQVPAEAPRAAPVPKGPVMAGRNTSSGASLFRPLVLVVAVAAAGGYWWMGQQGAPAAPQVVGAEAEPAAEMVADAEDALATEQSFSAASQAALASELAEDFEPETDAELADTTPESADASEPEAEAAAEVALETAPEAAPEAAIEAAPVEVAPEAALEEEPVAVVSEPQTQPSSPAVAPGAALALTFSEESWVEVTDATGNKLIARLQPAGSTVELTGEAPFSLMLGNAAATTVSYAGEVVDSAPLGNRRTRKLTVGG